jgi:hypothetical protein
MQHAKRMREKSIFFAFHRFARAPHGLSFASSMFDPLLFGCISLHGVLQGPWCDPLLFGCIALHGLCVSEKIGTPTILSLEAVNQSLATSVVS